jgi:integrase
MLEHIPDTLIGRRDRAILLIGFAAALRRSELAALNVADVEQHADGLLLRIGRSKTDQEGAGARIPIPRATLSRSRRSKPGSPRGRSPVGPCSCRSARAAASAGSAFPRLPSSLPTAFIFQWLSG